MTFKTPLPIADPPSPCVQVCMLDARDVCIGCGRSLAEIGEWSAASRPRRQEIVTLATRRRALRDQDSNQPL